MAAQKSRQSTIISHGGTGVGTSVMRLGLGLARRWRMAHQSAEREVLTVRQLADCGLETAAGRSVRVQVDGAVMRRLMSLA